MRGNEVRYLNPFAAMRGTGWVPDPTAHTSEMQRLFAELYTGLLRDGTHPYDLDRVATAIFYLRTILERTGMSGRNKVALEVGCGQGNKSLAICDLFGSYYGIDVQSDQIRRGQLLAKLYGRTNVTFVEGNASDLLHKGTPIAPEKVDVLILYAVLEHLTLSERETILDIAGEVMRAGGDVLVMETPNRLIPFDSHTSGVHFFNALPDELAVTVAEREMTRRELAQSLALGKMEDRVEALYRLGRGVSYHEFSTYLGLDWASVLTPFDSLSNESLNMTPLTHQEVTLFAYLQANLPEIPASAFSRSWLDLALRTSEPRIASASSELVLSPSQSGAVTPSNPVFWSELGFELEAGVVWEVPVKPGMCEFTVVLPHAPAEAEVQLMVDGAQADAISVHELTVSRPPLWHDSHAVSWQVDRNWDSVGIRTSGPNPIACSAIIRRQMPT